MPYDLNVVGWFVESQLQTIEQIAKTVPEYGIVVEIGSMYGRSTVCWAQSCPDTATIYAIDLFLENKVDIHNFSDEVVIQNNFPVSNFIYRQNDLFDKNTAKYKNIKKIVGESPYNISYSGGDIDVLFLDAAHYNPNDWDNIKYFLPYVKEGGIICGHDYSEEFPDIIENVSKLEKLFNTKVKIEHQVWQFKVTKIIDKTFI